MIEDYAFGQITIDGRIYRTDVIIYPDGRVQDNWWRSQGHRLKVDDIDELIKSRPQWIVAGTGASGRMRPDTGLEVHLQQLGIRFEALPSAEALARFNRLYSKQPVGACFHLTC
jgi:hypothetical protein